MALLPVQPDLQALFAPILHTQRELARAHEIICQVDDLSDYTDDNHLQEASLHLAQVRQRLRAVITHLKLRLTIQMIQLARFFRTLSPDQHHPDRQLRLSLSPEQIEVLVSLCLPKARARRNGDTDHAPQSRKG